jgi:Tfp pilus assembly protein PilO
MTGRDRIVLIAVVVLVVIAGGWMLVVSPERKKADSLGAQVSTAQSQLSSAETQLTSARAAESQYPAAYASVVSLGKAVPASQEVPSLMFQLSQATGQHQVVFNSIVANSGTNAASASASAAAASAAAANAGFTQMPFTFVFGGGFFSLEHLFRQLTAFTTHTASGGLEVSGRLLTIQSVKLAPESASTPGKSAAQRLSGTINATAYVLPASQGLTAGATPSSPTGAAAPAAASGTAASSPTAPAIAKVTP